MLKLIFAIAMGIGTVAQSQEAQPICIASPIASLGASQLGI
jgi:hypothetical protein